MSLIRDMVSGGGGGGGDAPVFSSADFGVYASVDATSLSSNVFTKIPVSLQVGSGSLGLISNGSFIVENAGFYQACGFVPHDGGSSNGHRRGAIFVDNQESQVPTAEEGGITSSGSAPPIEGVDNQPFTCNLELEAGQSISLYGWQNSGGTKDVVAGAWLCVNKLGNTGGQTSVRTASYQYNSLYQNLSPTQATGIDTGVDIDTIPENSEIFLNCVFSVNASGSKYVIVIRTDKFFAKVSPDTRVLRSAEPVDGLGDIAVSAWLNSATNTIFYSLDVDGGGKTLVEIEVATRTLINT